MNDAVSNETLLTVPMTEEALLGNYPRPASRDGSESHRNGAHKPKWLNWPKRCERALLRYLSAREGQGFPLGLARAEVEVMEGPARSFVKSSVQRGAPAAA